MGEPDNGHAPLPPADNQAQVNIPLPEGHAVVNYVVVLITDKHACLLHGPTAPDGKLDLLNAMSVLLNGLESCTTTMKSEQAKRALIHVVPPSALSRLTQ